MNADIDGQKDNSKGDGQVVDVDARAFPPKPKAQGTPSTPDKPKDVPQPPPQSKGDPQQKVNEPAHEDDQATQKEQDVSHAFTHYHLA